MTSARTNAKTPPDAGKGPRFQFGRPRDAAERSALLDLISATFHFPREQSERYADLIGDQNLRVTRDDAQSLTGGLAVLQMGQFFGGKSLRMLGVAVVCTAPEHRAGGSASFMMNQTVLEAHRQGFPLSVLYPATLKLYRRAGYHQAGSRFELRVPLREIYLDDRSGRVRRITEADMPAIEALHRRRALATNGNIDRTPLMWRRVQRPRGDVATGYLVENSQGRPDGYLYCLTKDDHSVAHGQALWLTDFLAATPDAGRRLWTFLAHHRSLVDHVTWFGDAADPLLKLLPERVCQAKLHMHWMLRIVDVPAALVGRGYLPGLNAEVHLDVEDDLITANNGRYVLTISNGAASVETGGRGDVQIDVRGLAGLFSCHQTTQELSLLGLLRVATHVSDPDAALASLSAAFAGSPPWMSEMF